MEFMGLLFDSALFHGLLSIDRGIVKNETCAHSSSSAFCIFVFFTSSQY